MLFPPIIPTGYARRGRTMRRGAGDWWDDEGGYEDPSWEDPGGVITDPWDGENPDGNGNGYGGEDWTDNGDGSVTDPDGYLYDIFSGEYLGWESALGDGSWFNPDGQMFDSQGNWLRDDYLVHDEQTDTWYDAITGEWFDSQGRLTEFHPREAPDGTPITDEGNVSDIGEGFFEKVGNLLKNLFGGSGSSQGGGQGGGGSSSFGSAAQSRQSQAEQALAKAQQSGTATTAQLAALQRQLAAAEAAVARSGGGMGSTIMVAAAVGLGVYALTSRRD